MLLKSVLPLALLSIFVASEATAAWGRHVRYVYSPVVVVAQSPAPSSAASPLRQVEVKFFCSETSLWTTTEALVPAHQASVGVLATVQVPRVGEVRAWIVRVYSKPKLTPGS